MVVEIGEQLAVLPQSLVEPGTVLDVELDSFVADDRLHLAHVSIVSAAPANPATACPVSRFTKSLCSSAGASPAFGPVRGWPAGPWRNRLARHGDRSGTLAAMTGPDDEGRVRNPPPMVSRATA